MAKGKRGAGRGKRVGKARAKRTSVRNVKDYASLSVNRTYAVGSPAAPPVANVLYSLMNTTLDQFSRAVQVAQGYQFYRIKNIALRVKPQFDTYAFNQNGGATPTGYGKPKLYYMFDKSGSIPTNISFEGLKQMGARPHNLDEKSFTIAWTPSVLVSAMTAGGGAPTSQPGAYKVGQWLNTNNNTINPGVWNPNSIDHLGVYWFVESTSYGGTGGLPYALDVEVQFEFKKPLWAALSNTEAVSAHPAVLDASPDGIEGGPDGLPAMHDISGH